QDSLTRSSGLTADITRLARASMLLPQASSHLTQAVLVKFDHPLVIHARTIKTSRLPLVYQDVPPVLAVDSDHGYIIHQGSSCDPDQEPHQPDSTSKFRQREAHGLRLDK
ncbi:hypothetical protein CF319_g9659, partial [Tilletia indica]